MISVTAEILTIGDEILFGQILDTNSQWISTELDKIGIRVVRKTSVGDNRKDILSAFTEAQSRAAIILVTGGLGPTNDDITKSCFCEYFNCGEEMNEEALKSVTDFFEKRGRELTPMNRSQASLPTACKPIQNLYGTAPGMWFEQGDAVFISMPGVPFEMKEMMSGSILPQLKKHFTLPIIHHQWIKTVGIGESFLADIIKDWEAALPSHIKLAYLPSLGEVKLRLTCLANDLTILQLESENLVQQILPLIEEYIYALEDLSFVGAIAKKLVNEQLTIATAESCTGGFVAHQLTSVGGSSAYFKGSIVAYHNEVKTQLLDVPVEMLQTHGAVSEEVVRAMAENVRIKLKSDIGIACSGVAGPTGGTTEKPVGTVWIAYADKDKTISKKLLLGTLRENNVKLTCVHLLNMVRKG